MDILIVKPLEKPMAAEIDGSLEEMQRIVGGRIFVMCPFDDSAAIICNEDAVFPPNRALYQEDGKTVSTIINGTFFVCDAPLWSTSFLSLSAEQLKRYSALFSVPEIFIQGKRHLLVIPCK